MMTARLRKRHLLLLASLVALAAVAALKACGRATPESGLLEGDHVAIAGAAFFNDGNPVCAGGEASGAASAADLAQ